MNPVVPNIRSSLACLFLIASPICVIAQDTAVEAEPATINAGAEASSPATSAPPKAVQTPVAPPEGLKFNFAGASWSEVLRWFAEQADLSLQIDAAPSGTVNFSDPEKTYSVSEGLDLLNRLLLDRGWAVVRRGRMLLLVDLEADNAEKLISEMAELVTPEVFESRGQSDIVRCVFPLGGISPEQAREELGQIIGPWGRINVLAGARQVVVTETVGKLKVIGQVLATASEAQSSVIQIALKHRAAEEIMEIARPLLELEPGTNSNDQIRISVSIYGDQLFATGDPSKLDLLSSIVTRADTAPPGAEEGEDVEQAAAVLKTHLIEVADLQSVYDVLQTLLAGQPEVRLAIDENRQAIVALAKPTTQTQIETAIQELEGSGKDFEIISLRRLEPANALLTINKFFGVTEADSGNGPKVDGDPETGRLWVRGTSQQIETVKRLISELENDPLAGGLGDNVRILPFSGDTAMETMRQIESLWPLTGRQNRIRLVVPADETKDELPGATDGSGNEASVPGFLNRQSTRPIADADRQTLVWQNGPTSSGPNNSVANNSNQPRESGESQTTVDSSPDYTGDDIVIQLTPAGLVIASRDPEALDLIEQLINSLGTPGTGANDLPTLFWLKYLKADVASEIVASVLGGADTGGSAGTMAESVMGGLGGGMLGGLLGMGGGGEEQSSTLTVLTSRGSVNIVPDNRLNALIVQAPPADIEFIRTVLSEIDREESPETIQTIARPQLIPVVYQEAAQVAEIVKSVFGEKTGQQQEGGRGGGQPRPEDLIAALRGGGRGGRGGGDDSPKSEATKIIVAVDERSNSLVVTATPQDFQAVRDLVETLDQQGMEAEQSVEVIAMGGTVKPEIMQQALETILGKKTTTAASSSSSGSSSSANSTSTSSGSSPEEIQRRIEFFRSRFGGGTQGGGGSRGNTGRGGGGGPGGGGPGGGGGGRGGRGR